ncbi:unnamed protein product [Thelazia callipaeda]|uniref:STAS domain-containing protein n=1 Tax=Thelazia callipaeda TaxID=103827 RepID=A0A0N5CUE4_THECL|nr:unnamed protein product [Thelazia callipaeda]
MSLKKNKELTFSIERAVLNQEEFDTQFGYIQTDSSLRKIFKQTKCRFFQCSFIDQIKKALPIVLWLPKVTTTDFVQDVLAGITVGIFSVPQAMAYAALANVNTVVGLYTSLFPTLIYAVFGTSKHLTLGMFAVAALMTGNAIERRKQDLLSNGTSDSYLEMIDHDLTIELMSTLTFTVGFVMVVFAVLQLHFITVYLSDPVIGGFTTGAACHVLASQMPKLVGIRIPIRTGPMGLFKLPLFLYDFVVSLGKANFYVLIISFTSITILMLGKYIINPFVMRKIRVPIPFELFLMIVSIIVTYSLQINEKQKVAVVGFIPRRLPNPALPKLKHFFAFLVDAIPIAVVIYSVSVSVGKLIAKKHGYHISSSQELKALALCQLVGAFLCCHPASGSLSRALVNSQMGATSELSSIVSALVVLFVILVIGPLLYYLPSCVLASIITVALQGMFLKVRETFQFWQVAKIDLLIWSVSFLGTFFWNVSEGLGIAIVFAAITVIIRTQRPKSAVLGNIQDTELYRDINRYKASIVSSNIAIYRFDAPLLFLNSEIFLRKAMSIVDEKSKMLSDDEQLSLVIDASGFTYMDYTGVEKLRDLWHELRIRNVIMFVAASKAAARTLFAKCDIYKTIPIQHFFPSVHDAVLFAKTLQKNQKIKPQADIISQ